jgi:predicted nicotinamide N-methyase
MSVLLKPCSTIQSNLTIPPPPAMTSDEKQHQKRTVSLEIPPDAAPGDSLCFVVDGIELELCVPEGARPSDLLEISVGGSPVLSSFREEATVERNNDEVTRVPLANDKTLVLSHQIPIRKEETKVPNSENADGTHAVAWPAGLELVNCIQESRSSDLEQVIKESGSVLELGSGLGVVGLAMAVATDNKTKTICLTDCQSAMPLLEHNVEQNQHLIARNVTFHTRSLNWEQQDNEDAQKFDLIVGSDVLYNINLISALVATLKRHTKKFILLATRWRKPDLERRFFEDTNEFVDWKLVDLLTCKLSWKDYGNPTNSESNAYFWQTTVAVNGILKPLAEISEEDTTQMCKEEHDAWERLQIQVYIGKVKVIAGDDEPNTKRARVDS